MMPLLLVSTSRQDIQAEPSRLSIGALYAIKALTKKNIVGRIKEVFERMMRQWNREYYQCWWTIPRVF